MTVLRHPFALPLLIAGASLLALGGCATKPAPATPVAQPPAAPAPCLGDAQVKQWLVDYLAHRPTANPPANLDAASAACTRAKWQQQLASVAGPLAGYKAGLTNPAVQKRFNTTEPVWGALYQRMLLRNGSTVPAAFGARPLFEADMLVRVKSAAINQARTPAEVLANVDQVIPFIELPDLMVEAPPKLNGTALSAINVGARLGVVGQPMAVPRDAAARQRLLDGLQGMTVRVSDASGVLSSGKGSDILGHPLNAVVWLTGALRQQGLQLQPGQVVSLGSFSPLSPPKAGQKVTVQYEGLPGAKPVTVNFR